MSCLGGGQGGIFSSGVIRMPLKFIKNQKRHVYNIQSRIKRDAKDACILGAKDGWLIITQYIFNLYVGLNINLIYYILG